MLAYLGLGGMILGFVSIWFGFHYNSFGGYLKSILHDETLAGLGFVQTTVAVPLIARSWSTRATAPSSPPTLSNRVLFVPSSRRCATSTSGRCAISGIDFPQQSAGDRPAHPGGADDRVLGRLADLVAVLSRQPFEFWQENYFRRLIEGGPTLIMDVAWVLAKMVLGSALATLAAVLIGLRRKDVGRIDQQRDRRGHRHRRP